MVHHQQGRAEQADHARDVLVVEAEMPSVNLNTANSSSSAARVVVRRRGETHRRGTTAAGAYRAPFRPASLAVGAWVELTAARIAQ